MKKLNFRKKNEPIESIHEMVESIQTAKNKPKKHEGWNDSKHIWIDSSEPRM